MADEIALLIGLDDTDNLESCGTGYHARAISANLEQMQLTLGGYISRHQLLVSPLVPYTSHNSSACIKAYSTPDKLPDIQAYCHEYLQQNSADGSDAGLCICFEQAVPNSVSRFGFLAKRRVVTQAMARELAAENQIYLQGITGTEDGVIGALSAVGLHASGSDGRMLWLKGIRELADKTMTLAELYANTGLAVVQNLAGEVLRDGQLTVVMGPWPRAILMGGEPTMIVEKGEEDGADQWRVISKQYLKQF